ncbi:MAG: hypothetical protein KJN60_06970 [Boseongicola sp.]|nr:hypothetical protein [Boseongicola sp.]
MGDEFLERVKDAPQSGLGVLALSEAKFNKRPIVLLILQIGNCWAVRRSLGPAGHTMAALDKPMRKVAFNDPYAKAVERIANPVYPRTGRGIASIIAHLRDGGTIGVAGDIGSSGPPLLESSESRFTRRFQEQIGL